MGTAEATGKGRGEGGESGFVQTTAEGRAGFYREGRAGFTEATGEGRPGFVEATEEGKKHGALRPQKPLRLIRDGEVGGSGIFISNTYSLQCHHQNDSVLRQAAV